MVGANKCPKKAPTENMGSDIYDKLDGANTFLTFTQAERAQFTVLQSKLCHRLKFKFQTKI